MRVIGLTGGIASGKSLVSHHLHELGALIIDADRIARDIVEPGEPAWFRIVEEFGDDILNHDGSLNRKALGMLVFSDPRKLDRLNRITHPYIISKIKDLLKEYRESFSSAVVVLVAPLLFEAGLETLVDEIWVVYVNPQTQLRRLMERDGLTEAEAMQRIRVQLPIEEKLRRADRIIDNNSSPESTRAQIERFWSDICNIDKR